MEGLELAAAIALPRTCPEAAYKMDFVLDFVVRR
jgi:hypothetical protein